MVLKVVNCQVLCFLLYKLLLLQENIITLIDNNWQVLYGLCTLHCKAFNQLNFEELMEKVWMMFHMNVYKLYFSISKIMM